MAQDTNAYPIGSNPSYLRLGGVKVIEWSGAGEVDEEGRGGCKARVVGMVSAPVTRYDVGCPPLPWIECIVILSPNVAQSLFVNMEAIVAGSAFEHVCGKVLALAFATWSHRCRVYSLTCKIVPGDVSGAGSQGTRW